MDSSIKLFLSSDSIIATTIPFEPNSETHNHTINFSRFMHTRFILYSTSGQLSGHNLLIIPSWRVSSRWSERTITWYGISSIIDLLASDLHSGPPDTHFAPISSFKMLHALTGSKRHPETLGLSLSRRWQTQKRHIQLN